jgi:signal transduction histidine kinase
MAGDSAGGRRKAVGMNDVELARQARRLRFDDPAQEARFQAHDDERSLRQWRIATAFGAVVVVGLGLLPSTTMKAWQEETEAFGRFGLMLPWFFVALAFSWWRAQRHHMQLVGAVCVAASVSMYVLTQVSVTESRWLNTGYVAGVIMAGSQYLVGVAVAVPLRTRALAAAVLTTAAVFFPLLVAVHPVAWTNPSLRYIALQQSTVVVGILAVLIAVTWARERLQRVSFAQREQMEAMNAELARLNAEKNEFMAIAAHDLRAPLATVSGVAGLIKAKAPDAPTGEAAALIEGRRGGC